MRLLVTGGSGFVGEYVLREAARRGHETVALARSDAAARAVADCGARPVGGDLDEAGRLPDVFAAARCDALVNLASLGFGHAPAIIAAAEQAGIGRAVFVSTTAVTTTLARADEADQARRRAADPLLAAAMDDHAADDDLRRAR